MLKDESASEAAIAEARALIAVAEDETVVLPLSEALVSDHDVEVFTEGTRDELLKWDNFCRTRTAVAGVHKVPCRPLATGTVSSVLRCQSCDLPSWLLLLSMGVRGSPG